jgi:hypothetical protein
MTGLSGIDSTGSPIMPDAQRFPNCGREMPAQAPRGLCPACLLGGVMDSQGESQLLQRGLKTTAGARGDSPGTTVDASTDTDRTATSDSSQESGPSTGSALPANFPTGRWAVRR